MKDVLKADCPFWPHREIKVGKSIPRMVPISETDMNSADEAQAIEWCHMRADELGVTLREGE